MQELQEAVDRVWIWGRRVRCWCCTGAGADKGLGGLAAVKLLPQLCKDAGEKVGRNAINNLCTELLLANAYVYMKVDC